MLRTAGGETDYSIHSLIQGKPLIISFSSDTEFVYAE